MLSVPTLWIVSASNFLALSLVWTYVVRSYPNFDAAKFWAASSSVAAAGACIGLLRGVTDSNAPLLIAGLLVLLSCCLAEMGISRFYGKPVAWSVTSLVCGGCLAGLWWFWHVQDDMPMRVAVYSVSQAIPILLMLKLLLSRKDQGGPGARLSVYVAVAMLIVFALRMLFAWSTSSGGVTIAYVNELQAVVSLMLVFLSMAWNFGFLLMAIDRLRAEVADLALLDDLTGIANRRHFLRRLQEECALALRKQEPFALLAIDLDGFKDINDGYGHAAGDACLRHFTLMVQTRLRPGDLFARTGGDEFCVVLPATTLLQAADIARRILDACRDDAAGCTGADIPIAASIGVAEWTADVGNYPELLVANADEALYAAKNDGKNCFALCSPVPSLVPRDHDKAPFRNESHKAA